MPFCADLRACYSHFEVNMSWVYESLRESGMEFEFLSENTRLGFELYVEKRMAQYMVWRVFHHKVDEEVKVEDYDCGGEGDVWGFVSDQVIDYHEKYPKDFIMKFKCEDCGEFDELTDGFCESCSKGCSCRRKECDSNGKRPCDWQIQKWFDTKDLDRLCMELECEDCGEVEELDGWCHAGEGKWKFNCSKCCDKDSCVAEEVTSNSSSSATATPIVLPKTPTAMKEKMDKAIKQAIEHEDNDYCPLCNVLTNTKTCAMSRTCCNCREITFCDDCGSDRDECSDKDCWHEWETHFVCDRCKTK